MNLKPVVDSKYFYGRQAELRYLTSLLDMEVPQCGLIIGGPRVGKSSLLFQLLQQKTQLPASQRTLIYLNGRTTSDSPWAADLDILLFWQRFHLALLQILPMPTSDKYVAARLIEPISINDQVMDSFECCQSLLENVVGQVVLLIDSFDFLVCNPTFNNLLRALLENPRLQSKLSFVGTSARSLMELEQFLIEKTTSPVTALISPPVYLGMLDLEAALTLLRSTIRGISSFEITEELLQSILEWTGSHPYFLVFTKWLIHLDRNCSVSPDDLSLQERLWLAFRPVLEKWWLELVPLPSTSHQEEHSVPLQEALIAVLNGAPVLDRTALFELKQRGLIEEIEGELKFTSKVLYFFVKNKIDGNEVLLPFIYASQGSTGRNVFGDASAEARRTFDPIETNFSFLEEKAFTYLSKSAGEVRTKAQIKQAVWGEHVPSDSALQKLIERIREQIERDPKNPRYLIAVRGQGYVLREYE